METARVLLLSLPCGTSHRPPVNGKPTDGQQPRFLDGFSSCYEQALRTVGGGVRSLLVCRCAAPVKSDRGYCDAESRETRLAPLHPARSARPLIRRRDPRAPAREGLRPKSSSPVPAEPAHLLAIPADGHRAP